MSSLYLCPVIIQPNQNIVMKKGLKLGLFAGLLFFSATAMAKEVEFSLSFENGTAKTKTVQFEVNNAKNVSLAVYNDSQNEVYAEKIQENGVILKTYSFEEMPEGKYFLIAESNQKTEKYSINIQKNKVLVEKLAVTKITEPEYTVEGNRVKLHIANAVGKVNISVFDLTDNEYYNQVKTTENGTLDLVFDFNPETSDKYVVKVDVNGNSFNNIFSLK